MPLWEPKITSAKEVVFREPQSRAPCLVVVACQLGDTGHGSEMNRTGLTSPTGKNGKPGAEGFYLYLVYDVSVLGVPAVVI